MVTDIHFSHRGSDCSCKRVRGEQVNSNERGHALSMGVRRFSRTDGGRGLTIWRGLPGAWHRGRAGPARRQHRGDERPPGRDRPHRCPVRRGNDPPDHVLILLTPCAPHPRRRRMAWLKCPRRPRQPLPADLAALQPGTEPGRERLAISARQLARDQRLRQLRRYRRRLLHRLEPLRQRPKYHNLNHHQKLGTGQLNGPLVLSQICPWVRSDRRLDADWCQLSKALPAVWILPC